MKKKLFVDREKCYACKECTAKCSYFYHPANNGIISLLELITRSQTCRKCEEAPCVKACPNEALEKQPDGSLKRYSMRCTSCKTCALACPFGTIYPELLPYLASQCDYCLGTPTLSASGGGGIKEGGDPECVKSCPEGAVRFIDVDESKDKDIYFVGENLAVHSVPWRKE